MLILQLRGSAGLSPASPSESRCTLPAPPPMSTRQWERHSSYFVSSRARCFTGRSPVRTLTRSSQRHEMKIARTVLLICALLGSLVPPIFFLSVRHFHLEGEAAEWMVSLWPRSLGEVALEDRRAMADMLVAYGELAGTTMLTYSVIGWSVVIFWRLFFKRAGARDPSLRSG